MTVSTTSRKESFETNGVTTEFPFTFAVTDSAQVFALTTDSEGTETDYTNFTVILGEVGGTLTTGTVLDDVTLLIYRDTPLTQNVDYINGGRFPADSHEGALDKLTLQNQDQQEELDRTLKFSISNENILTLEEYDQTVTDRDDQVFIDSKDYTDQQVFEAGSITTKQTIARSLNVLDSEVIYSTDTVTILDDVLYIYDASAQTTFRKDDAVGIGETIVSVVGNVLTTSTGTYDLYSLNNGFIEATSTQLESVIPLDGEAWFNATDNTIHMGDGVVQGGVKHLNENMVAVTYKGSGGDSPVQNLIAGTPIEAKEGSIVSTGATSWKILPASTTKGVALSSGLKAISLNGLWIDDFGCVADGTVGAVDPVTGGRPITGTDNSAAYKTAVDAFIAGAGKSIMAGYGQYNFVDVGILSYANGQTSQGAYKLKGMGGRSKNTVFMMTTEGGGKWWYDNSDQTERYQFNKYEGVCFSSSLPANASFMRMYSDGYEQGFSFTDCQIEFMREAVKCEGSSNASEFKWIESKFFYITSSILTLDNTQSVNHEYISTDAEVILGDVVRLETDGGGTVKWSGGSLILDGEFEGAIVHNDASGTGVGTGNQDFTFTGIKTELKQILKRMYRATNAAANTITVKFKDSNLTTVVGGARDAVIARNGHIVRFNNCEIPQDFTYRIEGTNEAQPNNGLIEFEQCKDFSDLPSRVTISNFYGSVRSRGGVFVDPVGGGDTPQYAVDFDVNPTNNGRGTYRNIVKSASLMQNRVGWPYNSINEQSLIVPDNSVITKIIVYRPPAGGSSASYTLKVGNNDKTTEYGASTTTQQRFDHSFVVDNLNLDVGTDANLKRVRLWADGGDAAISNVGFVVVEYI